MPARTIACHDAEVLRIEDLSPSFRRVVFGGPGLERFGIDGPPLDLRIKLLLPAASLADLRSGIAHRYDLPALLDRSEDDGASWYRTWLQIDPAERGAMRTYTVRAWDEDARELVVDIVLHTAPELEPLGPAERWAREARIGDRIHILGPDREATGPNGGIEFRPRSTDDLLLIGDETAVPAIASILEALPADARGRALLEVPHAADVLDLTAPTGIEVRWLVREDAAQGQRLDAEVRALLRPAAASAEVALEEVDIEHGILWETPAGAAAAADAVAGEGSGGAAQPTRTALAEAGTGLGPDFSAWIAGEAGAVTGIRRYLVQEVGVNRRQVAFMGYWRIGRAEG
ncbi:siderophore-interacting protein [Brachybacterium hainanense]|uniref:Siderophore-interacting protein n=1 Tax=Brachybacterium hainanense TaxID=1541174 RepID=A0ABV6RDS2_9MICO